MYAFCNRLLGIGSFGWIGGIAMFIGFLLIGVLIYLLARNGFQGNNNSAATAQDVLKQRLAKGEIDETTYESLLNKIK